MSSPARWWTRLDDGRLQCNLCPRHCRLNEGQRAFCFVRQRQDDALVLTTYGRSTGFCIDPIEKKPLAHFYPGTPVLSFGTAGCNLGCRFCQNWNISKAREIEKLSATASPEQIARAAVVNGCTSVAFTYNDPVIWAEYAIDTARACRQQGIKTVAVTAGYITEEARSEFFSPFDAVNVDLKAFTETFYEKLCFSQLTPVLETLEYLVHQTDAWVEITTLLIPGQNDSPDEVQKLSEWVNTHLGPDVPLHFTAFHPDFKMMDTPKTPAETVLRARHQAIEVGLHYVYTGNIHDPESQSTYCPGCGQVVIERDWHQLGAYRIRGGACLGCGRRIAGHLRDQPGHWGPRRRPVTLG
ncbi:MAG: AmmeMemoRadiSam system radical SAM enzyme [Vulcanimicrobiota bacterium]